jgi:hypothetical protein
VTMARSEPLVTSMSVLDTSACTTGTPPRAAGPASPRGPCPRARPPAWSRSLMMRPLAQSHTPGQKKPDASPASSGLRSSPWPCPSSKQLARFAHFVDATSAVHSLSKHHFPWL